KINKKTGILSGLFIVAIIFIFSSTIHAQFKDEPNVLVIYSSSTEELDEHQRSLDMLISHFTNDVAFVSSDDVEKEDLTDVTHLFYYSPVPEELPETFESLFADYNETFVAIGYNSEQLGDHFSFVKPKGGKEIDQLVMTNDKDKETDSAPQKIIEVEPRENSKVVIEGKKQEDETTYPVMIKKGDRYFYGVDTIRASEAVLFGEVLHEIFEVDHEEKNPAYIQLKDVHPLVDYKDVKDIDEILKEKDLPYMVSVTPVYIDPETGDKYHFSDNPELLEVLRDIQEDGGSIVLHGYTHQFRGTEGEEGFEFWDTKYNSPIYAPADEDYSLKERSDFDSETEYKDYISDLKQFETNYIDTKLTKGIQELVKYGLYPLAFEPPHGSMSQNGYQVTSNYFSTYVGKVQLSDRDRNKTDRAPYITSPTFLHGMQLLPETMDYQDLGSKQIPSIVTDLTEAINITDDGLFSGSYYPYLGVENFKQLIYEMEKLPNIEWIDLKEMDVWVKADGVDIS